MTGPSGTPAFAQQIWNQELAPKRRGFELALLAAEKSHAHVFVVTAAYVVSARALLDASKPAEAHTPLLMDAENLFDVAAGCYICEQPWTRGMAASRCPGQPRR